MRLGILFTPAIYRFLNNLQHRLEIKEEFSVDVNKISANW